MYNIGPETVPLGTPNYSGFSVLHCFSTPTSNFHKIYVITLLYRLLPRLPATMNSFQCQTSLPNPWLGIISRLKKLNTEDSQEWSSDLVVFQVFIYFIIIIRTKSLDNYVTLYHLAFLQKTKKCLVHIIINIKINSSRSFKTPCRQVLIIM